MHCFYREFLEHRNTTFHANGTMSYAPVRTHKFVPERSIGDPTAFRVFIPNIPLLGVSAMASKWSMFAAFSLSTLARSMDLEPILNLTVDEYLWGYDDPLVKLGSQFVPNFVDIERFGLLDRMFEEGDNVVNMHLPDYVDPEPEDVDIIRATDFSIDRWNGRQGLAQWDFNEFYNKSQTNTACNTLRGTYDATLFPKDFRQEFRVYRKAFCRTIQMKHSHSDRVRGTDVEWFRFDENAFSNDVNDPDSSCYCDNGRCLKQGLGDISPCYYSMNEFSK